MHHNRLTPVHADNSLRESINNDTDTMPVLADEHRPVHSDRLASSSDESESEQEGNSEDEAEIEPRRYPVRQRRQRVIEGTVPWDTIENSL